MGIGKEGGASHENNDLDKSRGAEKHRLYRQKYKFGWKCVKGHRGDLGEIRLER